MPPRKKQRALPAAATSAADAASVVAQPPPPHTLLHADALESIFDFLSFKKLRSVMLVCQSWLAAVYLMRGLTAGKSVMSSNNLPHLLSSRLARHVSDFGITHLLKLGRKQLLQAVIAMPFLRELNFSPKRHADWATTLRSLQLPATLRVVTLRFPAGIPSVSDSVNAFINMLGQHASSSLWQQQSPSLRCSRDS